MAYATLDVCVPRNKLRRIKHKDIQVGDLIRVIAPWGSDFRHVWGIEGCVHGVSFSAKKGSGGCCIPDEKDWKIYLVEPNTAYSVLRRYQRDWNDPRIELNVDPRNRLKNNAEITWT